MWLCFWGKIRDRTRRLVGLVSLFRWKRKRVEVSFFFSDKKKTILFPVPGNPNSSSLWDKRHREQTRAWVWSWCFVCPTISLSIFKVKPQYSGPVLMSLYSQLSVICCDTLWNFPQLKVLRYCRYTLVSRSRQGTRDIESRHVHECGRGASSVLLSRYRSSK